jgi:hypothetical protein
MGAIWPWVCSIPGANGIFLAVYFQWFENSTSTNPFVVNESGRDGGVEPFWHFEGLDSCGLAGVLLG